jgi:hypothetical protein
MAEQSSKATVTRAEFNAGMEGLGIGYGTLSVDTRNTLWAAYNLSSGVGSEHGQMPVAEWADGFGVDDVDGFLGAMASATLDGTDAECAAVFASLCQEWLEKRKAATATPSTAPTPAPATASPPPPATPPSPAQGQDVQDSGQEQEPAGIQETRAKYREAVDTAAKSKVPLDVAKWGAKIVGLYVGDETDKGKRRAKRASAVKWCQEQLDDAFLGGDVPNIEHLLRAYGVASVFGVKDAAKLGIGRLNGFEVAVTRESDTVEKWAFKGTVTADMQTALRDFWAKTVAGTTGMNANEAKEHIRTLLGRKKDTSQQGGQTTQGGQTGTQTAQDGQQGTQTGQAGQDATHAGPNAATGQKPAGNGQSGKPADSPKTAVAPKNPADLAEHLAACLRGRTDNPAVWEAFGKGHVPGKGELAALVKGLLSHGPKTAVRDALRELITAAQQGIADLARQAVAADAKAGNQTSAAA